jgi:hypothetical protein
MRALWEVGYPLNLIDNEFRPLTGINRLAIVGQISEYWRLILTQPFE